MKRMLLIVLMLVVAVPGFAASAARKSARAQRVNLTVTEKGFQPARVKVKAGAPVTLLVTRKTDRTCATQLVLADYRIRRELPLDRTVAIVFTPRAPGDLVYACPMGMIKGTIEVEPETR